MACSAGNVESAPRGADGRFGLFELFREKKSDGVGPIPSRRWTRLGRHPAVVRVRHPKQRAVGKLLALRSSLNGDLVSSWLPHSVSEVFLPSPQTLPQRGAKLRQVPSYKICPETTAAASYRRCQSGDGLEAEARQRKAQPHKSDCNGIASDVASDWLISSAMTPWPTGGCCATGEPGKRLSHRPTSFIHMDSILNSSFLACRETNTARG